VLISVFFRRDKESRTGQESVKLYKELEVDIVGLGRLFTKVPTISISIPTHHLSSPIPESIPSVARKTDLAVVRGPPVVEIDTIGFPKVPVSNPE
jgi:hypothetical protein